MCVCGPNQSDTIKYKLYIRELERLYGHDKPTANDALIHPTYLSIFLRIFGGSDGHRCARIDD
jgi:hypothetical protein